MVNSTGNVLIDSSADLPLEIQFRIKLNFLKTSNSLPIEVNEIKFDKKSQHLLMTPIFPLQVRKYRKRMK